MRWDDDMRDKIILVILDETGMVAWYKDREYKNMAQNGPHVGP